MLLIHFNNILFTRYNLINFLFLYSTTWFFLQILHIVYIKLLNVLQLNFGFRNRSSLFKSCFMQPLVNLLFIIHRITNMRARLINCWHSGLWNNNAMTILAWLTLTLIYMQEFCFNSSFKKLLILFWLF
jgi:hypothetical protein